MSYCNTCSLETEPVMGRCEVCGSVLESVTPSAPLESQAPTPATHYPGPWAVHYSDDGRVWINETTTPEQLIVADIPGDMEEIDGAELCNAELIAAAPDLLAALTEALPYLMGEHFAVDVSDEYGEFLDRVTAALARVKGGAR